MSHSLHLNPGPNADKEGFVTTEGCCSECSAKLNNANTSRLDYQQEAYNLAKELERLRESIKAREMLQAISEPSGIFVKVTGDLGGERLQLLWKGGPVSCLQQVGGLVEVMEGIRDFQNSLPYRGEMEIFAVVRPIEKAPEAEA